MIAVFITIFDGSVDRSIQDNFRFYCFWAYPFHREIIGMYMFIKINAIYFVNFKVHGTILKVVALLLKGNETLLSDIVKAGFKRLTLSKTFDLPVEDVNTTVEFISERNPSPKDIFVNSHSKPDIKDFRTCPLKSGITIVLGSLSFNKELPLGDLPMENASTEELQREHLRLFFVRDLEAGKLPSIGRGGDVTLLFGLLIF